MTEPVFFDTDCLSAFLWVGSQNLVFQIYKNRVFIPSQVYDELSKVHPLRIKIDASKSRGELQIARFDINSQEANLYFKLTNNPDPGFKIIGRGEAAAISLAKHRNGILGSNNFKDIVPYVNLFSLQHVTTGDILYEALKQNLITEGQGNVIWRDMLDKQRKLPTESFTEYLERFKRGLGGV